MRISFEGQATSVGCFSAVNCLKVLKKSVLQF
ncbi:hypothetical protein BY454_1451, partial [Marinobacter persicus]